MNSTSSYLKKCVTKAVKHNLFIIYITELRRSARLRGLAPEYDGLHFAKRTRRSINTPDMVNEPLEVIAKKSRESLLSKFLGCFGFFSESEIDRRRSLRLRGLDPEFEGLTWGKIF